VLKGAASFALSAPAFAARTASADVDPGWRPQSLDVRELRLEGTAVRRAVLAVPRGLSPADRLPVLVLLHGLGETGDERTGAWAWFERYGLGTSYDRVFAGAVNTAVPASVAANRGLVLVCPYMPLLRDGAATDAYARAIAGDLLTRVRAEAPALAVPRSTYVAGCSLGGRASLDVFLRDPEAFAAWGGVQTAIDRAAGDRYAEKLAAALAPAPRDLFIETSSADPFREGNDALSRALTRRGVAHTFVSPPGAHDQPWLRRIGTATMLEWFASL
jgi:enterochelin esterase-like enzyme